MRMRIALGIFNNNAANLRLRTKFIILIGILELKIFLEVENNCAKKKAKHHLLSQDFVAQIKFVQIDYSQSDKILLRIITLQNLLF